MNNIKVSVIVPVYNESTYISNTLNSIINQDFDSFEIIIVNDGSTDNSTKVIEKTLKNTDIPHKIINQSNQGVSVARNNGINNAEGEYLVFIDGDDIVEPNHIKTLYNPKYDFSLTQLVKKNANDLSKPTHYTKSELTCENFIKKELKMEIHFNFCQLSYKTSIIKNNNIQFPKDIIYGEDTYFALKALNYGDKLHISNNITYFYTQHSESAISTSQFRRFEIVNAFEDLKDFYLNENKKYLAELITTSRIPKAIFGNMNYFFYNEYAFDEIMAKMEELNLFNKLSKYEGNLKFKLKVKIFLKNPKIYYKTWKNLKNSID